MEEAMQQSPVNFAAGDIVKGTIIEVRSKEVLVDIGYKSKDRFLGTNLTTSRRSTPEMS
jgi:ribosomal protein S1